MGLPAAAVVVLEVVVLALVVAAVVAALLVVVAVPGIPARSNKRVVKPLRGVRAYIVSTLDGNIRMV